MTRRLTLFLPVLLTPLLLLGALLFASKTRAGGLYDICAVGCTYSSIQTAVSTAPESSTLTIAGEIFLENVEITRSMTLVGAGSGLTVIDGQAADTTILVSDGAVVTISGVTIQNGDTTSVDGGGLLNESGTVTLFNSMVENNRAPSGAGIANDGVMTLDNVTIRFNVADELVGDISVCTGCAGGGIYNLSVLTVTNSSIYSNTAQFGGGIDNAFNAILNATNIDLYENEARGNPDDPSAGGGLENLGTMTLQSSTVRDNQAPIGAGIVNVGTITVIGSEIYANIAETQGGGLHNSFNATIQTSSFYTNQAGPGGGGGLSSDAGTMLVEQTAVYNNTATGSGGGIVHNVSVGSNSLNIVNSTISGNSTAGAGGGLRNVGTAVTSLNNVTVYNNQAIVSNGQSISRFGGSVNLINSLVATNQAGANCSGGVTSQGYNIADDNSCSLNGTADLQNTDPRLGPLQNNGGSTLTHALLLGSPAINSGSGCPAVDQRGITRPAGPACDRGAYEFDGNLETIFLPIAIRP